MPVFNYSAPQNPYGRYQMALPPVILNLKIDPQTAAVDSLPQLPGYPAGYTPLLSQSLRLPVLQPGLQAAPQAMPQAPQNQSAVNIAPYMPLGGNVNRQGVKPGSSLDSSLNSSLATSNPSANQPGSQSMEALEKAEQLLTLLEEGEALEQLNNLPASGIRPSMPPAGNLASVSAYPPLNGLRTRPDNGVGFIGFSADAPKDKNYIPKPWELVPWLYGLPASPAASSFNASGPRQAVMPFPASGGTLREAGAMRQGAQNQRLLPGNGMPPMLPPPARNNAGQPPVPPPGAAELKNGPSDRKKTPEQAPPQKAEKPAAAMPTTQEADYCESIQKLINKLIDDNVVDDPGARSLVGMDFYKLLDGHQDMLSSPNCQAKINEMLMKLLVDPSPLVRQAAYLCLQNKLIKHPHEEIKKLVEEKTTSTALDGVDSASAKDALEVMESLEKSHAAEEAETQTEDKPESPGKAENAEKGPKEALKQKPAAISLEETQPTETGTTEPGPPESNAPEANTPESNAAQPDATEPKAAEESKNTANNPNNTENNADNAKTSGRKLNVVSQ